MPSLAPFPSLSAPERAFWLIARLGLVAQGVVYLLLGILAIMAAEGVRTTADRDQALLTISRLPLGRWLLALLAVGLAGYVLWRFAQAAFNTENCSYDTVGICKRVFFACSALGYGWLAYYAAWLALLAHVPEGESQRSLISRLMHQPYGPWLLGAVALGVIGVAMFQVYQAFSGTIASEVNGRRLAEYPWQLVYRIGQVGYVARGVVWGLLGYYLLLAAWHSNPREARDTDGAFDLLGTMGPGVLLAVAAGFVAYGVYMLVRARYPLLPRP
ncbi:DUF1206 domain-containing protein [Hymenobacter busanensis]|uniref:DUF1206 domain-containing protein n=1 Tax=Hymenobacter busanensis TaxID=2607656 RepID=A0A7L4ZZ86_9BACT|nr:DUF1206 domain-containing protein [Hymenobacter busanensis]KAA9333228.1 DUF1206 domain-containing protein [Hymenobacter busanensis]QHJ08095.1 DUF1206 domain-containing protein [Hymenobacter busanensis]